MMQACSATSVAIRELEFGDIARLQEIDRAAHGEEWSHRAFVEQIEGRDYYHLVAATHADVVGHAASWLDGDCLRVINVAVDESVRGQRVATRLLHALLTSGPCPAQMAARAMLEVRPSNRAAQALYRMFGFAPISIEPSFYDRADARGSRDALVMVADPLDLGDRLERLSTARPDLPKGDPR